MSVPVKHEQLSTVSSAVDNVRGKLMGVLGKSKLELQILHSGSFYLIILRGDPDRIKRNTKSFRGKKKVVARLPDQ